LGIPDRYIDHAERSEQLAELGLDSVGIAETCGEMAAKSTKKARRVS
jgi:deoxyxylulose-5-phosphate synthase